MPILDETSIVDAGALIEKRNGPSTVAGGAILVSGTVARTTDFETGSPGLQAKRNGEWMEDPFTDDQAAAFILKGHGLVVLGGCSHSGIINTVAHMRRTSGVDHVHAVMGGFHLSGPSEGLIEPTVAAMKEVNPELIVPTHCTGWKATEAFARALPEQFILNTVGTTYLFGH
jgi:7,8-dihydropterin-6-yl-methyl-4-(beta-D-ribofuranosyl)aminobenzene 5'-phosphate synthase